MAEKSEEVVSSNSFSRQMLLRVYIIVVKETNGPYGTALSSRKRLFDDNLKHS